MRRKPKMKMKMKMTRQRRMKRRPESSSVQIGFGRMSAECVRPGLLRAVEKKCPLLRCLVLALVGLGAIFRT
jgi:hypothetical protein